MHDFGSLVYLDLHKTGSTYVSRWLKHSLLLEEKKLAKHDWIRENYDPDAFYFITIRHPVSLYSSLYRFGLDKKGDVYERLKKADLTGAYDSFETFVQFCLDENNARFLGYGFNPDIARQIGFMSFRYMKISLQFPMRNIKTKLENAKPLLSLEKNFIFDHLIKNENLNDELLDLSTNIKPEFFDQQKSKEFLENTPPVNASKTESSSVDVDHDAVLKLIAEKEHLLLKKYA